MIKQGKSFSDSEKYRILVEKLIYLTITKLGLSFAIGVINQFVSVPCIEHWNVVICILRYLN